MIFVHEAYRCHFLALISSLLVLTTSRHDDGWLLFVTDLSKSFPKSHIMIMKRMGPNTVPWGIPDVTLYDSDSRPFADICWDLPTRNSLIQMPNLPETTYVFNL